MSSLGGVQSSIVPKPPLDAVGDFFNRYYVAAECLAHEALHQMADEHGLVRRGVGRIGQQFCHQLARDEISARVQFPRYQRRSCCQAGRRVVTCLYGLSYWPPWSLY
jgi:hypothetical protein